MERKVVVTRVQQVTSATVFDRFILWLGRVLKALIDRFMPRNQAFKFLKLSSLSAQLKKHVDSAKEKGEEKEEQPQTRQRKDDPQKASEGPSVQ